MTATAVSPGPRLVCYLKRKRWPRAAAAASDARPALRRRKPTTVQATSSSSSAADASQPRQLQQEQQPSVEVLATDGRYVVTPFDHDCAEEVAAIVALQTAAFAKPPTGIAPWDAFERSIFAAEVLSQMRNKLKYSKGDDNFVLLVARELSHGAGRVSSSSNKGNGIMTGQPASSSSSSPQAARIAGVVEVSLVADGEVLTALRQGDVLGRPDLDTVAYLASMATAPDVRRRGVARLLLRGAEAVAARWGDRLTLHVYVDNAPAVSLYESAGFEAVWRDRGLAAALTLQRPRLLMHKQLN